MNSEHEWTWVLNPGAELELRQERDGYFPPKRLREAAERLRKDFDVLTLTEPTMLSHETLPPKQGRPRKALFWCPTRSAIRSAQKAGLEVGNQVASDVLRRVHDKAFLSSTPLQLLSGHRVLGTEEEWWALHGVSIEALRLKRRFGFAGRGQRTMKMEPSADDRKWIENGFAHDGFVAEPHIDHTQVYSIHGMVTRAETFLGQLCSFTTDSYGAPQEVSRSSDAPLCEQAAQAGRVAAVSLQEAQYYGPFALDFLGCERRLFAVDLNPRFSMGWSVGMMAQRKSALSAYFADCALSL